VAYDPVQYWNTLSGVKMRLSEVGWPNWTEAYNSARYRLSLEQVSNVLDEFFPGAPRRILELGCGVGFWTDALLRRWPESRYTGVDLSRPAVEHLRARYAGTAGTSFVRSDVAEFSAEEPADLLVCLEVLLHIVDDDRWRLALGTIGRSLAPGGIALISDPISMHSRPPRYDPEDNCRIRHIDTWTDVLHANGLEVVAIRPRTLLLDNNFDFRTSTGAALWRAFFFFYRRLLSVPSERLGAALGALAYRLDRWYARGDRIGHSCKLLVVRKVGTR
jgi:SAM-dependent methyltransferase